MVLPLLLTILKAIGLILLCIIAVILFIVIIVLFVPFSYKIRAEKCETINGEATLSWLFGIIRIIYELRGAGGQSYCVKLFGIKIRRGKSGDGDETRGRENSGADGMERKSDSHLNSEKTAGYAQENQKHTSRAEEPVYSEPTEPLKQTKQPGEPRSSEKVKGPRRKDVKEKAVKDKREPGSIKRIWQYEDKYGVFKQIVRFLKRLLKIITKTKIWADIKFGTGQPHTTGYLLALCWAFVGFTGLNINTEGDFKNASFSGRVKVKGRIFICSFVWVILLFIFNKNIFPIVKKIIFGKDEANG